MTERRGELQITNREEVDIKQMKEGGKNSLKPTLNSNDKSNHNGFFDNEIMNVKQAAHFLRVSTKTIYEKSKIGLIPHQRIGSKYLFLRSELVRFLKGD